MLLHYKIQTETVASVVVVWQINLYKLNLKNYIAVI